MTDHTSGIRVTGGAWIELKRRLDDYDRLKQERDELLEALVGIMELVQLTKAGNVEVNTEWRGMIIEKAGAIIAKVEK